MGWTSSPHGLSGFRGLPRSSGWASATGVAAPILADGDHLTAEQSEGIGRVIKLVDSAPAANEHIADDGGMHQGMQGVAGGMQKEKTG